jgi:hypothetical protein
MFTRSPTVSLVPQPEAPLHWHEVEGAGGMPFMAFFDLDPSENPTVRPKELGPELLGPVPGENGLVVVARTLAFERGLVIVGRHRPQATLRACLDAAKDVA